MCISICTHKANMRHKYIYIYRDIYKYIYIYIRACVLGPLPRVAGAMEYLVSVRYYFRIARALPGGSESQVTSLVGPVKP